MKIKSKRITWTDDKNQQGTGKPEEHTAVFDMEIFPLPKGIIVEKDIYVKMRDGVKLALNVYRPDKPGKFPVVLALVGMYGRLRSR